MRKGMWSAAAFVALSGAAVVVLGMPAVRAADSSVKIIDKDSPNDVYKWRFEPAELTVPAGTKVVWTNEGAQPHTVTADDNSFDSKDMPTGAKFEKVFASAGEFRYHCEPHPWMKATIKVTGTGGGAPTPTTAPGTTPTTQPAPGGATTTTRAGATGASTSTTVKNGAAANSTTTTTAGTGVTSTTQAPSATPTSAPDVAGETTPTTAAAGGQSGGDEAAADHSSEGGSNKKEKKNSPIGMAFASLSTLLLAAIAGKLLASKA